MCVCINKVCVTQERERERGNEADDNHFLHLFRSCVGRVDRQRRGQDAHVCRTKRSCCCSRICLSSLHLSPQKERTWL